jgi:hypothetical protein
MAGFVNSLRPPTGGLSYFRSHIANPDAVILNPEDESSPILSALFNELHVVVLDRKNHNYSYLE